MATTTSIKVILTKAGTAYSATQQYRLHDYIVIDDCTMYVCKRVDPTTMTCVGHDLTDSLYWDKCIDFSDAVAKATAATEAANTATANAEAATEKANTATANADTATAKANTATTNANTATEKANTAAEKTNTAISDANTATSNANKAADACNTATADSKQQVTIAKAYNEHPPKIGDNGNWWTWDGTQYVDTGLTSVGGTMYPTFYHSGNKLYIQDTTDTLAQHVKRQGNKVVFSVLEYKQA